MPTILDVYHRNFHFISNSTHILFLISVHAEYYLNKKCHRGKETRGRIAKSKEGGRSE